MTKRALAQRISRRILFERLDKKMGWQGGACSGDFYSYPLATACYPDAAGSEEWGILPPNRDPESALFTVRNGLKNLYWDSHMFGVGSLSNLDLLYSMIFGVSRDEYEKRFLAKHPEVQRELEDAEKRYLDPGSSPSLVIPPRERIFPIYIVCDESASMADNGGIDAINTSLPELHARIASDPLANELTRLSVVAFAEDAEVLVPLEHAADIDDMPGVKARGSRNYGEVFQMLKALIDQDIAALVADGCDVRRTIVFFITGGEPTDSDWRDSHQKLVDRASNPHAPSIIAFGVDGAEVETIKQLATAAAFMGEQGLTPDGALIEILSSLWQT